MLVGFALGFGGHLAGTRASRAMAAHKTRRNLAFAVFVALVRRYVLLRGWQALRG